MNISKTRLRQIIKEELTKHINEYQDPSLNDKQKQVIDLIMRDGTGLIDLIDEMGNSAPSMLDTYIILIRTIVASGIDKERLKILI